MDTFLETHNLPKLSQEEAESLDGPTTAGEIEAVIKKLSANKNPGLNGLTGEFYQAFREELTLILFKLFITRPMELKQSGTGIRTDT